MTTPKLDTSVNLQNLLSALMIAGGLVAWAMRMESRMSAIETHQKAQVDVDKRQDSERSRIEDLVLAQLQRFETKLDRHTERGQ